MLTICFWTHPFAMKVATLFFLSSITLAELWRWVVLANVSSWQETTATPIARLPNASFVLGSENEGKLEIIREFLPEVLLRKNFD